MGDGERFRIVRSLGADAAGFVARDASMQPPRLVVLERATRAAPTSEERARIVQRCRLLVGLEHPKVVPVRDVMERDGEVLVVCDFVDGEWLSALMAVDPRPPTAVLLRIIVDVLEGLAALHDLGDDKGQSPRAVHGALSPDSVLVADDGVAEIARPFGVSLSRPDRFVAPELRRGEAPADVRADVYSAGAMLREVLGVAPADARWAEPLTDIAWRACSVDPENRWPSAAAMATALRRAAGPKLASADDVASNLRRHFGARIRARRASLDLFDEAGPPSSGEPISVRASDMMVVDPSSAPTMIESRPPPVPVKTAVARVTLVKKSVAVDTLPQPAIERGAPHVGQVTQRGMAAAAPPPFHLVEPPLAPKPVSLPPPDIIVPDVLAPAADGLEASTPSDAPTEAYRRRLPTFSTLEAPPRRSTAVQAMAIAAAMVSTFGVGWWLGRNHPPPSEVAQAACPSIAAPGLAAAAPKPADEPVVATPTPPSSASPGSITASSGSGVASSAVVPTVTTVTTVTTAPMPPARPPETPAAALRPRPSTLWTAPVAPKPAAEAPAVKSDPKAAAAPPAPPRPPGSAGYVPSEL